MCTDRAVLLLAYTKQTLPLIGWYKRLAGCSVTKLIGLHGYRRYFGIYRKEKVLCQLKIRGAIEKFKTRRGPY